MTGHGGPPGGRADRARTVAGRAGARTLAAARGTGRLVRRATTAQGAGESGLSRVIELHAVNNAADAIVAVGLANTLFFAVPVGEARGRVALYLLVTMAPFALVAPVIGPLLDRLRHGRRYALATTLLGRAFLAWVLAGAVTDEALSLYPAAFGVLIGAKAYGVTRATVVPRVLPPAVPLVGGNARVTLAGVVAGALGAAVASGAAFLGDEWPLRLAFVVYLAGMVLAMRLPGRVDSTAGEEPAALSFTDSGPLPRRRAVGGAVVRALRANATLRAWSGFLTMFFAFLLREHPIGGLSSVAAIGAVVASAGVGSAVGTALGACIRSRSPEALVVVVLGLVAVTAVLVTIWYVLATVLLVAAGAGFAQSLGKLSLDAILQRDVPESRRASTFARSETLMQLSWVVGGGIGIALPLGGRLGLAVVASLLAGAFVLATRRPEALRVRRPGTGRAPGS